MANRNYNTSGTPTFQSSGSSAPIKAEFAAISEGFAGVEHELDTKATLSEIAAARGTKTDLAARLAVVLNVDGTMKAGTTVQTPPNGDVSDRVCTTQFVAQAALTSSLPGQSNNKWAFLTTDGTNASWKGGALGAFLDRTPITSVHYSADGIDVVTYATGHVVSITYTDGYISSITYYDTDGITQIFTENINTVGGRVVSTAWGIPL